MRENTISNTPNNPGELYYQYGLKTILTTTMSLYEALLNVDARLELGMIPDKQTADDCKWVIKQVYSDEWPIIRGKAHE